MKYDINLEAGIVNRGNWYLIKKCMQKAMQGHDITVGFLGGSITQGSLASTPEKCYAYLVYQWWVRKFPGSTIHYVNAGVGGTSSQFGVARVYDDLLSRKPDFCIVEFSVNDENTEHFKETYEGLIRCILKDECGTGLMLVHNVFYDENESAEEVHQVIGKAYQLPSVSMKSTILPKVKDGTIQNRDITPDDLHPNDAGHELVSEVIIHLLEKIYMDLNQPEKGIDMPLPITANQYEFSKRYQCHNYTAELQGFQSDFANNQVNFVNGWTASAQNDKITLHVKGSGIAVQYRKTIHRPTPIARVVVDGLFENAHILDGNFEENWGDCLYIDTVCKNIEDKVHTVEIEIIETHVDDQVPFYLLSVIGNSAEHS